MRAVFISEHHCYVHNNIIVVLLPHAVGFFLRTLFKYINIVYIMAMVPIWPYTIIIHLLIIFILHESHARAHTSSHRTGSKALTGTTYIVRFYNSDLQPGPLSPDSHAHGYLVGRTSLRTRRNRTNFTHIYTYNIYKHYTYIGTRYLSIVIVRIAFNINIRNIVFTVFLIMVM